MGTPYWIVRSVCANPDYTLNLTFADGSKKVFDARYLLERPIYSELKNVGFFLCAKTERGTVAWNDDLDIAPERLYECGTPVKEFS